MPASKPKILALDIETAPSTAYVWNLWGDNVSLDQLIEPGRVLCWAAKWLGKPKVYFGSEWSSGSPRAMMVDLLPLLTEADAVLTYNGDKFDLPKINGTLAELRMPSPGPLTSIDLYKTVKKLGFVSNKLAFVAPKLRAGSKVDTGGFRLWVEVMRGNAKAQKQMEKYNKQDVRLLEPTYKALLPFIKGHPHLAMTSKTACAACGSDRVQSRGVRRTKSFFIVRRHCLQCGSWHDGARSKAP